MSVVTFTETIFAAKGKEGVLPGPDADGYYTVVLGGLNCYNSANEYYVAKNVVEMLTQDSVFTRRVKNGSLFSEVGHPRREAGMSVSQYYARVIDIVDTNICGHISEVTLDMSFGMKNPELKTPEMIAIMGKVKPAGPKAETLRISLENRKQNTAFSVRGITDNRERNGRIERELTRVITFDHVTEPGIKAACKAFVPGLESILVEGSKEVFNEQIFKDTVQRILMSGNLSTESSREFYKDLMNSVAPTVNRQILKPW